MLNIHFPAVQATNSTIVLIPGGGLWTTDANADAVAQNLANTLQAVTIVPSYTLDGPQAEHTPPEVVLASDDVACAIAWTQKYVAKDFGGTNLKFVIAGYSAGAELAATMGADTSYLTNAGVSLTDVGGVAAMSGRYDYSVVPYGDEVGPTGWANMHGTGNSPLSFVQKTAYSWLLTYEQCDADTQPGNFARFAAALSATGSTVWSYEDGNGGVHGTGYNLLMGTNNGFYNEFAAFEKNTSSPSNPNPGATSGLESIPLDGSVGATDVSVGGDGSIWFIEAGTGNQAVAKYSNPGNNVGRCILDSRHAPILNMTAARLAVDGYGDPWVAKQDGTVMDLQGGLNATGWSPVNLPAGVGAIDIGSGGAFDTHNVWIVGNDGNLYQHVNGTFAQKPGPSGVTPTRVTVDSVGNIWIASGSMYYWRGTGGVWHGPLPGNLVELGGAAAVFGIGTDNRVYQVINQVPTQVAPVPVSFAVAANALGMPVASSLDSTRLNQLH